MSDLTLNFAEISTTTLQARRFPASLTVVSTPDVTPPQIQSLEFTPATLNVSTGPVTVTARMRLTDTQTSLKIEATSGTYQLLTLATASGNQTIRVPNSEFRLVSGTRTDGIWEASFVVPRYAAPGVWSVQLLRIGDTVNNYLNATASSLAAAGVSSGITVSSSPADTTMPTLTNLSISPASIDPSLTQQTVTVAFGVQDTLSGVDFIRDQTCPCEFLGIIFSSPSSGQTANSLFNPFTQISGSASSGTWQGTVIFPRFAEAGTWNAEVVIKDRARNQRRIPTDQLRAAGFPSNLIVIRASYLLDGTVGTTGGTINDQTFGSQARLTIPSGALPGTTSVSIDVLGSAPDIAIPQGFSAPGTRFVNIDLIPHPTAPISDPGYTLTIPLDDPLPPGTPLDLFRFDPILGRLERARSISAAFVTGTVDPSGITATFRGIASFSTVVGLLPSSEMPGDVNGDKVVNCADLSIVRAAFGKRTGQPNFDPRADTKRDGVVDISDLSYVLQQMPAGSSCH